MTISQPTAIADCLANGTAYIAKEGPYKGKVVLTSCEGCPLTAEKPRQPIVKLIEGRPTCTRRLTVHGERMTG